MPKNKPLLIFDLDGTILSINSFPYWARFMLFGKFGGIGAGRRIVLTLQTVNILAQRKLLRRNHYWAKQNLQRLWQQALARDSEKTALMALGISLYRMVRASLKQTLKAVADGSMDAVLATAAAEEYAIPLGRMLGFTHMLATGNAYENLAERKRDNVMALIQAQGWEERRRIFFTDHSDDLPLIKECQLILWFGSDKELSLVKAQVPEIAVVPCLELGEEEITKLIACA